MFQLVGEQQNQYKISAVTKIIATVLLSGYFPVAPGTVGSFVSLLIYWFFVPNNFILIFLIVLFFIIGVFASEKNKKNLGKDPSVVVIDEAVGMWISVAFLPKKALILIAAFFIFRLMDIIKPPPARYFDRLKGGFAIMMDDVVAGVYANIITQLALIFLPLIQR